MKNIVIGGLLLGAAAVLAHMYVVAQRYYPMVKVEAPEGVTYIAVQDMTVERQACGTANARLLEPIKATCKQCKVVQARCERVVQGDEEKKLLEGTPLPNYLVVAPGVRMSIEGPDAAARRECDFIAKDVARRGVASVTCIHPKTHPA